MRLFWKKSSALVLREREDWLSKAAVCAIQTDQMWRSVQALENWWLSSIWLQFGSLICFYSQYFAFHCIFTANLFERNVYTVIGKSFEKQVLNRNELSSHKSIFSHFFYFLPIHVFLRQRLYRKSISIELLVGFFPPNYCYRKSNKEIHRKSIVGQMFSFIFFLRSIVRFRAADALLCLSGAKIMLFPQVISCVGPPHLKYICNQITVSTEVCVK